MEMVALGFVIGYLLSAAFFGIGFFVGINVKDKEHNDNDNV